MYVFDMVTKLSSSCPGYILRKTSTQSYFAHRHMSQTMMVNIVESMRPTVDTFIAHT